MSHSFVAYVDECGDDGFGRYRERLRSGGSSHWLGVGAVVWRMSRDLEAVQWAKAILADLPQQNRKILHFKKLDHAQRVMALTHLSDKPFRIVCVMAHKPSLQADRFAGKNQLYHHLCRYLIERISWLCRDARRTVPEGDGRVKIIFARRGGMSYPDFQSYLTFIQTTERDARIHWPIIDIEAIEARDQSERYGLQLADLSVSGLCAGLEPDFYGNVELRYARILRGSVFARNGNCLNYGAKLIHSPETIQRIAGTADFTELFGNVR